MTEKIRRIGVLTGGGDCPGLNAVLRAVTKAAIFRHRVEVVGIEDGFLGLIEDRMRPLSAEDVSGILTRGGTILGTNNRANPARFFTGTDDNGKPVYEDRTAQCLGVIERHGIDALIVIGGDGTMACTAPIAAAGINCIGVPKTIDNDIIGTDITFGFMTAYNTATYSLDRLHSTAASHHRVMVCELMGRNAGWLTLHAGIASGSDVILIPEIPFNWDVVADFCIDRSQSGRGYSIICCSEGARPTDGTQVVDRTVEGSVDPIRLGGIGKVVADEVENRTGIEARTTVLGHVQRGGTPVAADRVLATQFGYHALDLLMRGMSNRMVVMQNGVIGDMDLFEATTGQRLVPVDHRLIDIARSVRTSFGDI